MANEDDGEPLSPLDSALPTPLFDKVCEYLRPLDLVNLSLASRALQRLVNDDSYCWKQVCRRFTDTTPEEWNKGSYKELAVEVGYGRYGLLLRHATWCSVSAPYGGFIYVEEEPPSIVGYSIVARRSTKVDFERVAVFRIDFGASGVAETLRCFRGGSSHGISSAPFSTADAHTCALTTHKDNDGAGDEFELCCSGECEHDSFERQNRKACVMEVARQGLREVAERLHFFQYHMHGEPLAALSLYEAQRKGRLKQREVAKFRRLDDNEGKGHPLAGFWRGSYSLHGVEFIRIAMAREEEGNPSTSGGSLGGDSLVATKITGDPHIWAGKVTFKIDLSLCSPWGGEGGGGFSLPEDYIDSEWDDGGEAIQGRQVEFTCPGVGQIADIGYKSPQWTPVKLVAFEGMEHIAVVWEALRAVSIFERFSTETLRETFQRGRGCKK